MISAELKQVILQELSLKDFDLTDTTTAAMVPGWDSLNHARVVAAVEDRFGIRFKTSEVMKLKNVGDLQAHPGRARARGLRRGGRGQSACPCNLGGAGSEPAGRACTDLRNLEGRSQDFKPSLHRSAQARGQVSRLQAELAQKCASSRGRS